MKKLSKNELLIVGLMLFSLFFGAGNLIFPPFLGQESGSNVWLTMSGFIITAVGFPILGVIAVSKTNGLQNLAAHVNPKFSLVYTILIYLSIGPLLGIPRAGSLPYEMAVAPFMPESFTYHKLALLLFTTVFFIAAYLLALNPTKLVDRMGKILTPILLFLLLLVFVASFFKDFSTYGPVGKSYERNPVVEGFLGGYLTMDTIAALNFGVVISVVIKDFGISENNVVKTTVKAGLIAGFFLIIIYASLAHLGALSGGMYGSTENGAQTLANVITYIFGNWGLVLLALIFTLACLTTSIGLITSCSQYFSTITKLHYKQWVRIFTVWSLVIANLGLTQILKISVPILDLIYPVALVLISLSLFDFIFKASHTIYFNTVFVTAVLSLIKVLDSLNFYKPKVLVSLPWYDSGLAWVLPALVVMMISTVFVKVKEL